MCPEKENSLTWKSSWFRQQCHNALCAEGDKKEALPERLSVCQSVSDSHVSWTKDLSHNNVSTYKYIVLSVIKQHTRPSYVSCFCKLIIPWFVLDASGRFTMKHTIVFRITKSGLWHTDSIFNCGIYDIRIPIWTL